MILGVTGGIGSGKTTAADYLHSKYRLQMIDADVVAREVVEPGEPALEEIAEHFGANILLDGHLNRAELRKLIFDQPEEKIWLEKLLHPIIRDRTLELLNSSQSPITLLVSPLLFETDQFELCDITLVIDVPHETQVDRVTSRDANSAQQVEKIIATQLDRDSRNKRADFVVSNDGNLNHLYQSLDQVITPLLKQLEPENR